MGLRIPTTVARTSSLLTALMFEKTLELLKRTLQKDCKTTVSMLRQCHGQCHILSWWNQQNLRTRQNWIDSVMRRLQKDRKWNLANGGQPIEKCASHTN